MNRKEWKWHFTLKRSLLSFLFLPTTHFKIKFEAKPTDTSAELGDILGKLVRDYSLVQNPTVVNRMPLQ